jgi:hypothetical protein
MNKKTSLLFKIELLLFFKISAVTNKGRDTGKHIINEKRKTLPIKSKTSLIVSLKENSLETPFSNNKM